MDREALTVGKEQPSIADATGHLHLSAAHTSLEQVAAGYKRTEVGVIPEDWVPEALLRAVHLPTGQVDPRREPYRSMVLVAPDHIEAETGRLLVRETAAEQHAISGKYAFKAGDIVYSKIRPYLRKAVLVDFNGLCSADMYPLTPAPAVLAGFMLAVLLGRGFSIFAEMVSARSGIPKINRSELAAYRFALPPRVEQRAIADALSDVDGLIGASDKLIAKKRAIKQAAMQQLLTGKTRLPSFSGEWDFARIDEHACIKTGAKNTQDRTDDGQYPFFVRSQEVERINTYSYDGEAVLTAGDGVGTGKVFHYIHGRFDAHQRVYRIAEFSNRLYGRYFNYQFRARFYARIMSMTAKSSVDSVRMEMIAGMQIPLPLVREQQAIAAVLSDMDAEITALERRRDKTKQIKQGMMQQLLTGRVRLVKPDALAAETEAAAEEKKGHSWQFNEAVVISVLTKQFSDAEHPLGRKRYTKLAYLLQRHTKGHTEGYLKKAAGPYNPRTRYAGPEKIALKNDYIRETTSGSYRGFIAGDNFAQAEGYFDKWYDAGDRQWLRQFRYQKNDDLELLTTVDVAVEELRASNTETTVDSVKTVILANKEWKPKLSRDVFSDDGIARAIETCRTLFGRPEGPVA